MTEREKMISIVRPIIKDRFLLYCLEAKDCINCETDCQVNLAAKDFADAFIAANIGDVKERKFEADHYWRMWQGSLVELERAEHRAEVAERQAILLSKWLAEKTRKDYPWQAWFDEAQKQAEKELAEEDEE